LKNYLNKTDIKALKIFKKLGYTHVYKDQYYGFMLLPKRKSTTWVEYTQELENLMKIGEEYSIEQLLNANNEQNAS